jgi:hypothetical protein
MRSRQRRTELESEKPMHDLITSSIAAHGGLTRWNELRQISATLALGGVGFKQRGQEAFTQRPTRVTVDTREQRASFEPFLAPGQRGVYEPHRTAVQSLDGTVLEQLENPRPTFRGWVPGMPWRASQLAYFAGYAMWTYFTMPFLLLRDGIECQEVEPWTEGGETWRALKVSFPKSYVTHSTEEIFYFDAKGLIRRNDYTVEVANAADAVHYLDDHQMFDGIVFPTKRRVYRRGADREPLKDPLIISIDLSDFQLTSAGS